MLGRILGGGRGGRRCPRGIEERRQLLLAPAVAQAAPCQHRPPQGHHRLGTVVALLSPSPQSQRVLLQPRCHRSHVSSAPEQHPAPSPPQHGFWEYLGARGTHQPSRVTPSLCHLPPAPRINPKPHPPTRPLPAPLLPQRCPGSPGWVPGGGEGVRGASQNGVPRGRGSTRALPGWCASERAVVGRSLPASTPRGRAWRRMSGCRGGGAVPQGARATSLLVGEGEARLLTCPD